MIEIEGNIWDYHARGHWIVITTNGCVRKDGAAVMGRGIAAQTKDRIPDFPYLLGHHIVVSGNTVGVFSNERIITMPVKHNWWERANLELIEKSAAGLSALCSTWVSRLHLPPMVVYMVRPGCGNGGLSWEVVKPILEKYLDDRFVVIEKGAG